MKINMLFCFFIIILTNCNLDERKKNSVNFNIEGIIKDYKKISTTFEANVRSGNGIIEIENNSDSTIYVATDSNFTFIPPVYYSYYSKKTNSEISNIEAVILPYGFVKIEPNISKKFITRIPFIPFENFKRNELILKYAYTTNYKGIAHSDWKLISQKFSFDFSYTLKPVK